MTIKAKQLEAFDKKFSIPSMVANSYFAKPFEDLMKEVRDFLSESLEDAVKHSQQQLLESLELEFQERYGKDGGDALVIISSHDGGVTQRPALPEVKALIQSKKPL